MDKQFSDLPTTPVPVVRPPRSRRKLWLLVVCVVCGLVVVGAGVGFVVMLGAPSHTQARGTTSGAQRTAPAGGSSQAASSTTASSTAPSGRSTTPGVVPTSRPQTGQPGVTHGRPHLGGPLTDFTGKYGSPSSQGDANSLNFWIGPDQTIDLNVNSNEQGNVAQVTVLGADTWTTAQTQSYCEQFLPDGAVQTASSSNLITYHNSTGTIDLKLPSATSCSLAYTRA